MESVRLHLPVEAWSDSWALTHWILLDTIQDVTAWIEAALNRNEPSILSDYGINVCNYTLNRRFVRLIRKQKFTMLSEWMSFVDKIGREVGPADVMNDEYIVAHFLKPKLIIPPVLAAQADSFVIGLFPWVLFLSQSSIVPYYDKDEGIGVRSGKCFDQGEKVVALNGLLHYVGFNVSKTKFPQGMRWSFFEDCYMSGPVSIINCSCSKHRNVNMRPCQGMRGDGAQMQVVTEWCVNAGDKLYAAYSDDSQDMLENRGIRCLDCVRSNKK